MSMGDDFDIVISILVSFFTVILLHAMHIL